MNITITIVINGLYRRITYDWIRFQKNLIIYLIYLQILNGKYTERSFMGDSR